MIRWIAIVALSATIAIAAPTHTRSSWRAKLAQQLPLLGHRNWVVVADSAYPWQTSPGVDTVETGADHIEVLKEVLRDLERSPHVRPIIYMDSELQHVSEEDAPGVSNLRLRLERALKSHVPQTMLHEKIIGKLDEVGKTFHVLLLKTNLAVPYTSVFLQLDCKYWSADSEKRLRQRMSGRR